MACRGGKADLRSVVLVQPSQHVNFAEYNYAKDVMEWRAIGLRLVPGDLWEHVPA